MLFATALISTAVAVVWVAPRSASSRAVPDTGTGVPDNSLLNLKVIRIVLTDEQPVYYCNDGYQCPVQFGFAKCENGICMCDDNFYEEYNSTSKNTYCHLCSRFQESCAVTQCCQNPHATLCFNDMCVCRPGMDEECLGRYTPTLGIQLANTLSVSFAFVFLAITFVAVIRKTLFKCSFFTCDTLSRTSSDSSLNEFVQQKMEDRPPCYDDIEKEQPPPEYNAKQFGRADTFRGAMNRTFSISDEVEMNTTPPNYSTFTTITNVLANDRTDNNEIILTQPIYTNSPRQT